MIIYIYMCTSKQLLVAILFIREREKDTTLVYTIVSGDYDHNFIHSMYVYH